MFKRNFAALVTTALLSVTGAVQAATSPFPSAAEEGSEYAVNAPLPAAVSGLDGAQDVFPSAAAEGGEPDGAYAATAAPRNLERSYAGGHGNVFPGAAME